MNKKDLQQIRELFNHGFAQIWEYNLEPILTDLQNQINRLPTKDYIDQKIAEVRADFHLSLRNKK